MFIFFILGPELGIKYQMTEYVVLTAVQQFRTRYVVPVEDIDDCDPVVFIEDSVTCREIKEFSQLDLNENIVDVQTYDEDTLLLLFDKDNAYLSGWSKEDKLKWIRDWRASVLEWDEKNIEMPTGSNQ